MKLTFANPSLPAQGIVAVTAFDGGKLSKSAAALDAKGPRFRSPVSWPTALYN